MGTTSLQPKIVDYTAKKRLRDNFDKNFISESDRREFYLARKEYSPSIDVLHPKRRESLTQ